MAVWTNAFNTQPDDSEGHGRGGERIRDTRFETRARFQPEHSVGDAGTAGYSADDGRHNPGSARAYAQNTVPTALLAPDGSTTASGPSGITTALSGADDVGRLLHDLSGVQNQLRVLTSEATARWTSIHPYKNFCINGSTQIWQRGLGPINCPAATETFVADRFYVNPAVAQVTAQRAASSAASWSNPLTRWVMQITVANTVTSVIVGTRIESTEETKLTSLNGSNGEATISFRLRNDSGVTVTPTVNVQSTDTGNLWSGAAAVVNRFSSGALATLATANDAYYSTTFSLDTMAGDKGNGLEVEISIAGAFAAANNLYISEIIIEPGSDRSTFVEGDFDDELWKCKRYYEKTYNYTTPPGTSPNYRGVLYAFAGSGSRVGGFTWRYANEKASGGAVTAYNPETGATGSAYDMSDSASTNVDVNDISGGGNDPKGTAGTAISLSGATSDDSHAVHAVCDAELT
jgi:hypothetical protein